MIDVQYPKPEFRIKNENDQRYIFDRLRKTWLVLTEEEWVRQNFILYLVEVLKYPSSVIAVEKEIQLNELKKRFDILVYDAGYKPWMLVECKEPGVSLSEDVLRQVLRYNISVPVDYIVITNGNQTIGWKKEADLQLLTELPAWQKT
ncbi:MAG TPA: type I restriction enzyme HsdR N-terminal domain-containing protein [Flavisolibacter sp.]